MSVCLPRCYRRRTARSLVSVFMSIAAAAAGCSRPQPPPAQAAAPGPVAIQAEGLENVYRLNDRLYSGSSPEGDEGFRSLRRLGVRTVLSVDGARPEVERAERHGLRYVHLPVGYDGIRRGRGLEIARAVRDLPGPVYIHCHHGQHRGPAAAAVVLLCEGASAEQAADWLRLAGTDPRYVGLIGIPRTFARPRPGEIDQAPADFPAVSAIPDLARHMVEIDGLFDRLKLIREAGWASPPDHPDLDPAHEALLLAEHFREAARVVPPTRPPALRESLSAAAGHASDL